MNGVLGMGELLLDTPLNEEQTDYLSVLNQSARALMEIINDILDFSKMEAAKLQLEPIAFELEHLVYDACKLLSPNATKKGLDLVVDYSPDCYCRLVGDPGRLRQILLNLLNNAIKFTAEGYVLIGVDCRKSGAQQMTLRFQIKDTGIGIASHVLPNLFQAFTQADASTTRRFGGTGLGLAICKQLVELMGGDIGVSSEQGKGSTFHFTLTLPLASESDMVAEESLIGVRTLLLGTTEVSQKSLNSQLVLLQLEVVTTFDSREIVEMLKSAAKTGESYQLIIIDEQALDSSTFDLANQIRSNEVSANLPLILLTSLAQQGAGKEAERAGYTAFLTKPVNLGTLRHALAQALTISGEESENVPLITRHTLEERIVNKPSERALLAGKILLVEDVLVNQKVAVGMLKKLGFDIDVATNGREAVSRVSDESYDLIMMDCQMPEMDGYEATKLIRELEQRDEQRTPIIALTANVKEEGSDRCYAAGMDDFLAKPFTLEELQEKIACWLSSD